MCRINAARALLELEQGRQSCKIANSLYTFCLPGFTTKAILAARRCQRKYTKSKVMRWQLSRIEKTAETVPKKLILRSAQATMEVPCTDAGASDLLTLSSTLDIWGTIPSKSILLEHNKWTQTST